MKGLLAVILITISSQASAIESWDSAACRGAIALEMMKEPEIMEIYNRKVNTYYISYVREGDGKLWRFACKNDASVLWASINDDGSQGRWRDHAADDILSATSNGADSQVVKVCSKQAERCIEVKRRS
tara:strand:- start:833 stop:1216 length:384 start_codon:yes stop_codon:yes gene_type:complete